MTLNELLKDSAYKLTQFSDAQKQALEDNIIIKQIRDKSTPYIVCLVRGKEIKLTPEEVVRQLFIDTLNKHYGYSLDRIQCEYPVKTGSSSKRADIVIFDNDNAPYIIVELKQPNVKDGQEQLKSYCRFEGAPLGVWTNGADIEFFLKNQNVKSKTVRLDGLSGLPTANQSLAEYLHTPFTIKDLIINDKLERRSLKEIITQFEDVVLANSGADSFEEIFKLIFTKLFDEFQSGSDKDEINALLKHGTPIEAINGKDFRPLQFRSTSLEEDAEKREAENKKNLEKLFAEARKKWRGIFPADDSFKLTASHLSTCVSYLQDIKLFNSNLEVIDDAFEYLVNQESKGNKGQYFTPRYVIDMCVKMMNPQAHESMIDTAAGSCGFPMHTIFHVWQGLAPENTNLFTTDKRTPAQIEYVQNKVFGIDFDARSVRVGRALNLIAGDGQTNVLRLNTLDYKRWDETVKEQSWINIYNDGFVKLNELAKDSESYKEFEFDVLMANPPFAGDIKDELMIRSYELGKKQESPSVKKANKSGKLTDDKAWHEKISRDVLFIERNLDFLKDGGRMAIVLPQGRFNNSSDKYLRDFIAERCRILAVVGLHGNTFKPHTGTKTSVLFVQKWDDVLCPKKEDYPIFFATMQKSGKDNSGEKIYIKNEDGSYLKDKHGHFVVEHDLFSTELSDDSFTEEGIAEAFILFAKNQGLSFVPKSEDLTGFKNLSGLYAAPFNEMKYRALLERLEISVLMLNDVMKNNEHLLRIEAEYFSKKYLMLDKLFANNPRVGDYTNKITCGPFGSNLLDTEYIEYGVLVVRPFNLKSHRIEDDNLVYISEDCVKRNNLKKFKIGTLLFSRVGDIKIGVLDKDNATISPNIIAVEFSDVNLSKFLSIFFATEYGFNQIERQLKISAQPTISTGIISELKTPNFSEKLICSISNTLDKSHEILKKSRVIYSQAENLLLNALGIADFSPSTKHTNEKSFKDSFLATGRLDAEYYQPKYDELEAAIAKTHQLVKLQDLLILNQRGTQPSYAEQGLPVINSKHVREGEVLLTDNRYAVLSDKEEPLFITKGDVLINGTGVGTIGRSACYLYEQNALPDNHVTILRTDKVNPIYLSVYLNSIAGKYQVDKYFKGSSGQIELYPKDINEFYIPLINSEIQTQIADLIQQSFKLKSESEALLNKAKRAVEIAIETDEKTAMDFINQQTISETISC